MDTKQFIDLAYRFEIASIESNSTARNPYCNMIKQLDNGDILWEVVNLMVESYTNHHEQYKELEQFTNRVCKGYDNLKQIIEKQSVEIDDLKQQLFTSQDNPLNDLPF